MLEKNRHMLYNKIDFVWNGEEGSFLFQKKTGDSSMEEKKILYAATVVKTHIMQFHVPYLRMLQEMGWHTEVAAISIAIMPVTFTR